MNRVRFFRIVNGVVLCFEFKLSKICVFVSYKDEVIVLQHSRFLL